MRRYCGHIALTIVLTASWVTGCSSVHQTADSTATATATPSRAPSPSALIGPNGATVEITLSGMRATATAPAGVSDPGVPLTISRGSQPHGQPFAAAVAASAPVSITLGSGLQPKQPIELRFDLSADPQLAGAFSDSVKPVIRSVSGADGSVIDLLPAAWDPATRTVSAATDHLSVFQVIAADLGKVVDTIRGVLLPGTTSGPSCTGSSQLTIGSISYTLSASKPDAPVTGCLRDAGAGAVGVDFANSSSQFYGLTSSPAGTFTNPTPLNSNDQLAVWLFGDKNGLLTPRSGGQLVLPAGTTTATINVDVNPVALQLNSILTGLGMLGIDGDQLVTVFQNSRSAWDCALTAMNAVQLPKDAYQARDQYGSVAQCLLAGIGAAGGPISSAAGADPAYLGDVVHRTGVALSLVTTLPDQFFANIAGAIGEVTGKNHLEFTLNGQRPTAPARGVGTLQLSVFHSHTNPGDTGVELAPNHFQLSKTKHDGTFWVDLGLRWKTSDGKGLFSYCTEQTKVLDSGGGVVLTRKQRLATCDGGGGWDFPLTKPGTYTYVVDLQGEPSGSAHGEQQFTVDP